MADRTDENGAAYAGSQLQTQLYVNKRTSALNEAVVRALPPLNGAELRWVSPLAADRYREYKDMDFLRTLGLEGLGQELGNYWPSRGPVWDGLAKLTFPAVEEAGDREPRPVVLLAEGKSYPGELYGSGCQASDPQSRAKIEAALAKTQNDLGVTDRSPADWCGPLYQTANRLAHLWWLRSQSVHAWFVHLLFVDDPHSPTSAAEWKAAIDQTSAELGLPSHVPYTAHVLLDAGSRAELVG